uniref:Uncharacterized protein n=1 Tax=Anopheles merus TaxID=30066 RepID=A0A182UQK2_ANOME
MAFKFVLLATLVAAASAGLLPVAHHGSIATSHSTIQHHAAPAIQHVGSVHTAPAIYQHSAPAIVKTIAQPTIIKSVEHHAPANYEFSIKWLSYNLLNGLRDFNIGWFATYNSVESIMVVSSVIHDALMTIGIQQTVLALHLVTVACLVLTFHISSVRIVHGLD